MIKNKIIHITKNEVKDLKEEWQRDDRIFVVELQGEKIKNRTDYLETVYREFDFPVETPGFDGYNDWIRDLDWLGKEEYVLIINHFKEFMNQDFEGKELIFRRFRETILPFWESEVEVVVVDGKSKKFNIYLVD